MLAWPRDTKAVQAASSPTGENKLFDYIIRNPHEFNPNLPKTAWDFDWDKRDPASLVPPPKSPLLDEDISKQGKNSSAKPTATRHLFLIRHGQYNLKGATDEEKTLTPLVSLPDRTPTSPQDKMKYTNTVKLFQHRTITRVGSKQNLSRKDSRN